MKNLCELQQQFQNYLLGQSNMIASAVVNTQRVNAEKRLNIYSDAYVSRLLEVLEEEFPGLHTLLGDQRFYEMGQAYLSVYPSTYRSLRWLADHLIIFLKETAPYRQQAILAEMALFERTLQNAFDGQDSDALSAMAMSKIAPERWGYLRFTLCPTVFRLDFNWNVVAIWQAVQDNQELPQPEKMENPIPWLVWRSNELRVLFNSLSVSEAWAIDAIIAGQSFAEICEGLCEWMDEEHVAPYAGGLLRGWLDHEIIEKNY